LKIAFILWQHSTFPQTFPKGALGGAESATWHLARELSKKHEVEILCQGPVDRTQDIEGVLLTRVKPSLKSKWVKGDLYFRRAMAKALDKDAVLAITCIEPALYSDRVAIHLENDLDPYLPFPSLKARYYLRKLNRVRYVTGVSRYVSRRFVKMFDYPGRVATLLNGADCEEFSPKKGDRDLLEKRFGFSDEDIVLVYAGAVHRRKGLHLLLDAMRKVDPRVKLLILGGLIYSKRRPEDARYLDSQLTRARRMPQVIFVGPVSKPDISRILASSDIFVCPSIWNDPCPLVCAEAQASGIPVIGFERGGIPELVETGKTGLIVDLDPSSLAASINELVRNGTLRKRMGRMARARAERALSWAVLAEKMESLLEGSFALR